MTSFRLSHESPTMRKKLNPVGVFLLITRLLSTGVVRTCSNCSVSIFQAKDLVRQSNMDSLSARSFMIVFIASGAASLISQEV